MDRIEVFLNAGEFHFHRPSAGESRPLVIRTLLGSCVSIVLWNPAKQIGGMCHAVLPAQSSSLGPLDGNHCPGAVKLFLREIDRSRTRANEYQAFLMGGARMSLGLRQTDRISVGERNVAVCRQLLADAGLALAGEHVGLSGPRRVAFDLTSGSISLTHQNRTSMLTG
jgi:chemotaxis protein CheD